MTAEPLSVFAHINFEEEVEGKEILSNFLSSIHLHLKTLLQDTIQRRHLWFACNSDRYLTFSRELTSSKRFKTAVQNEETSHDMENEMDTLAESKNDECPSMVQVDQISPTEYFINLTEAASIVWNYELLLHTSRGVGGDISRQGNNTRCISKACCVERHEEELIHLYEQIKPFRRKMNTTDTNHIDEPAAYRKQYWDRPLWAWNFEQILLVKALNLIWIGLGRAPKERGISVGISTTKTLSRIPFLYQTQKPRFFNWTLLDPHLDQELLKPLSLKNLVFPSTLALQERAQWAVSVLARHGVETASQLLTMPHQMVRIMLQNELHLDHSQKADCNHYQHNGRISTPDHVDMTIKYLFHMILGESVHENRVPSLLNSNESIETRTTTCQSSLSTNIFPKEVKIIPTVITPSSPQQPRLDRNGIDLNVFEQLPLQLRSEVRVSFLQKRNPLKRKVRPRQSVLSVKRPLGAESDMPDKKMHLLNKEKIMAKGDDALSSEIDSHGIDLRALSQLPPQMRSEVRSSVVLSQSKRSRTSVLERWLNKNDSA